MNVLGNVLVHLFPVQIETERTLRIVENGRSRLLTSIPRRMTKGSIVCIVRCIPVFLQILGLNALARFRI